MRTITFADAGNRLRISVDEDESHGVVIGVVHTPAVRELKIVFYRIRGIGNVLKQIVEFDRNKRLL
jgi:hypothetical protein